MPETTDGRRARRQRGRAAVTDAMIALYGEGHLPPTIEQIAERAGVSVASVYRYFNSIDDLIEHALGRFFATYAHLFEVPEIGEGRFPQRVRRFVDARLTLFSTIAGPARMARVRALEFPRVAEGLAETRRTLADQVRTHFAPELADLSTARRDDRVALIDSMTSFEAWDLLGHTHQRSTTQIRRAWTEGITALCEATSGHP